MNSLQFWKAWKNITSTVSAKKNYYDFLSLLLSLNLANPALGNILRGGVWFSPMGISLQTSEHEHLHLRSCKSHSSAQKWWLVQEDSRGNLCHQAAWEVLQTTDVAEDQGTNASCTPDDLQPSVQTGNTTVSNMPGYSIETELIALCRFLHKQGLLYGF